MDVVTPITAAMALIKATISVRDYIQKSRHNPKRRARLQERADKLLDIFLSMGDATLEEDLLSQMILGRLQSVQKALSDKKWRPECLTASTQHDLLKEAEQTLDVLISDVTGLSTKVRCLNRKMELPSCQIGLHRCAPTLKFLEESLASDQPLRVIAIYGQPGIGKTTLLGKIWDAVAFKAPFHARAYVQVGETATAKIITRLQSQIYWQLSNQRVKVVQAAFGREELAELLGKSLKDKRKPVFLAIDNVFDIEHLRDLLPSNLAMEKMPHSSCIAVTCRDYRIVQDILRMCHLEVRNSAQVHAFEPQCLTPQESKEVFAHSAQIQHTDPAHQDLLNAMVPLCAGLPLVLEHLGSIFVDESKRKAAQWARIRSQWDDEFGDPDNRYTSKVTKALRTSYECLMQRSKEAFLDIVMSFYGWHWDVVESILGEDVMTDLRQSSLVRKVDDKYRSNPSAQRDGWEESNITHENSFIYDGKSYCNENHKFAHVSMHDSTLRFGKSIIDKPEYVEHPLMSLHDLPDPNTLRNVILTIDKSNCSQQLCQQLSSYLQEALRLQTLVVRLGPWPMSIPAMIKYKSDAGGGKQQNLCFLSLEWGKRCSGLLEEKISLGVPFIRLQGWAGFHGFLSPCINGWVNLKFLSLVGCTAIVTIPEELGSLSNLQIVVIDDCSALKRFPPLRSSDGPFELTISCCHSLISIGEMSCCLKMMHLCDCGSLTELPHFGPRCLKTLQVLDVIFLTKGPDFAACESIMEHFHGTRDHVWSAIWSLTALEKLPLQDYESLVELPDNIGDLASLKKLTLWKHKKLQQLPSSICSLSALEMLDLSYCESLVELPHNMGDMASLKWLQLTSCQKVQQLPSSICSLSALERLDLPWCENLMELPHNMGDMASLKELCLTSCKKLQQLPSSICNLSALEQLDLSWCENLVELPHNMGDMTSLKWLQLISCKKLQQLPSSICSLSALERLDLSGCEGLVEEFRPDMDNSASLLEMLLKPLSL